MAKEQNMTVVKANTSRFRKECKARQQRNRLSTTMNSIIKVMEDDNVSNQHLESFISLAQPIEHDSDENHNDSWSQGEESE